ncbi:MAG: type 3 dihydrofolate reductase [Pseudomonadales bacterium]|nr:type 3 dihydrofolate reductase [Pseudomonadales bacterium]
MRLSLVVAMAANRVIGRNNGLPWHLPEDLKYFKRVTLGKPVIMGRVTFESIGRPLPGRTNIVVSRNPAFRAPGVQVVHDLATAQALCETLPGTDGEQEAMVIGGAEIYRQALPQADRIYLTEVHAHVVGDACFPDFDRNNWREVAREDFDATDANPHAYSFLVLER